MEEVLGFFAPLAIFGLRSVELRHVRGCLPISRGEITVQIR